jgi:hypothetical protein
MRTDLVALLNQLREAGARIQPEVWLPFTGLPLSAPRGAAQHVGSPRQIRPRPAPLRLAQCAADALHCL